MRIPVEILILGVLGLVSLRSLGEEKALPVVLKELEKTLEEVIEASEPSVACILVSRSEEYRRWGALPANDGTGKLGKFDGVAARRPFLDTREEKNKEMLNLIRSLDLAAAEHNPESYGSGIVLDQSGLVLTNAHVVRNATKVYVRLPGGKGSYADIHASDPRSDLAVLRLIDPIDGLKPLPLAEPGKYRKGQLVLLLANPFAAGFHDGSPTASWGMIANVRRRVPRSRTEIESPRQMTLHHHGTLLQIDTRIEVGCSGGALLNLKGELIGITTAQAALTGLETPGGFAVPLDAGMRRVIEVLKRGEEVEYGFLGVVPKIEAEPKKGVVIESVSRGSPAGIAGLSQDDRILTINGSPVNDNDDLFLLLGTSLAGTPVRIEVQNPFGPKRTVTVRLGKFAVPGPIIAANRPLARFGLRVDYTSLLHQREGLVGARFRGPPEGVLIREVIANSPADRARLQVDKVITKVNNSPVTTPAEYYEAMAKAGRSVEIAYRDTDGRGEEHRVTLEGN
jgi:serine protease Do